MGSNSYQWGDPKVGMTLQPDGWILSRRINARTTGQQWLATEGASGKEVIVYFPSSAIVEDEVVLDEWIRRLKRLTKESSPIFQRLFTVVTKGVDWPFAVIESIDGFDLNHFRLSLEDRTIPLSQLKGWLAPLSKALDKAHSEKRFHRSFSPESLVLNKEGELRVLYYGWLALFCELEQRAEGGVSSALPVAFQSPQQLDGRPPRATDDIYAFAATLYELISSQPPFISGDILHQIRQVDADTLQQRLKDLGEEPTRVPNSLNLAIGRSLSKDPLKRFQSVAAFWKSAWSQRTVKAATKDPSDERAEERRLIEEPKPGAVTGSKPKLPMAKIPEIVPDEEEDEKLIREEAAGPYLPTPAMKNGKGFGVVFLLALLVVSIGVGIYVDRYRNIKAVGDSREVEAQLLNRTLPSISTNITKYDEFAALLPTPVENVGWLAVRTEPVSAIAELWLNTQEIPIEQVTPTIFSNLPPGEVEVRLVASGFAETNITSSIVVGQTNRVAVLLQVESQIVSLSSEPQGVAYVLKRGEQEIRSGVCPDEFPLRYGLYQLDYILGERRRTTYLRVGKDQSNESSVLFESGKLAVESNPEDADVFVGSKLVGKTPLTVTNLPPGDHRVIIKALRHRSVMLTASVKKDTETFVSKELEALSFPELQEEWQNSLGMTFVPVGSSRILVGVHEVTRSQYQRFILSRPATPPISSAWETLEPGDRGPKQGQLPVVNISWREADSFCRWLTDYEFSQGLLSAEQQYRIPNDQEWDLAVAQIGGAGAATDSFPWGPWPPSRGVGNYGTIRYGDDDNQVLVQDSVPGLAPVGSFAENRFGLYDLGGNVREWILNANGAGAEQRFVRGGSFLSTERSQLASDYRESLSMEARHKDLGFRVVLSLGEDSE